MWIKYLPLIYLGNLIVTISGVQITQACV